RPPRRRLVPTAAPARRPGSTRRRSACRRRRTVSRPSRRGSRSGSTTTTARRRRAAAPASPRPTRPPSAGCSSRSPASRASSAIPVRRRPLPSRPPPRPGSPGAGPDLWCEAQGRGPCLCWAAVLSFESHPDPAARRVPHLPSAVLGNGAVLATVSARGEVERLYWPHIDAGQHLGELRLGALARGGLRWLDEEPL